MPNGAEATKSVLKTASLPCDQCLHRKVRCVSLDFLQGSQSPEEVFCLRCSEADKSLPRCRKCADSSLSCSHDVIRRRPGRKKGSGNVLRQLRSPTAPEVEQWISDARFLGQNSDDGRGAAPVNGGFESSWAKGSLIDDPTRHSFSIDQLDEHFTVESTSPKAHPTYGSTSNQPAAILSTIPNLARHVDLFFEKLYPIWPIFDEAAFRKSLQHPDQLGHAEICLTLSICALAAVHIPGTTSLGTEPRKLMAQRFIREALSVRSQFPYIETATIITVQTSLFLSCAEVEFQKVRSSFFLLRESIMLAQELGYYDPTRSTAGLSQSENLCIGRTLFLLNLVERGLTILRNKPFAILMSDSPPEERFTGEDPRILVGLQSLSQLFNLLDKQFLDNWVNNTPGTPETTVHLLEAQGKLAGISFDTENLTDIQKADILIAQQWLRLVFWQSSMKQGLLSSTSEKPELTYQFPCQIARSLSGILESIPPSVIFLHGMAIFERIFEIVYSFIDSLILSRSLSLGIDELGIIFKVLREAPNCHRSYVQILETKLEEQVGGEDIILLLRQMSPGRRERG